MAEQFFTVEQAANLLHVHPITVRRQLRSGTLRGIKTGKLWRVAESALTVPPAPSNDPETVAEAIWRDMTGGNDQKRDAAIAVLIYAPAQVQEIITQRSGEAAAIFYASPEGQAEWEEQADWRALDSEPFFDDEDEDA